VQAEGRPQDLGSLGTEVPVEDVDVCREARRTLQRSPHRHDEPAARHEHPAHLSQCRTRVGHELQTLLAHHHVVGPVRHRQRGGVGLHPPDRGCELARCRQHLRVEIGTGVPDTDPGRGARDDAGTAGPHPVRRAA
jgi:hypothetical protein